MRRFANPGGRAIRPWEDPTHRHRGRHQIAILNRAEAGFMKSLTVVRTVADLRRAVARYRTAGRTIGMIPTMGALHAGHVSLVQGALDRGDAPVASIFVNPTQFGPNEDFAAYPRDEAADFARLEEAGCRIVFAPAVEEMYPGPQLTTVTVGGSITEGLCGPFRPGHFQGVATVVAKLLLMAMPDRGYFGEKDYQQLQVLKRMARDLAMPVEIVGMPTMREADGLALSSRNRYLSPDERRIAVALHRELMSVADAVRGGRAACAKATEAASQALIAAGFDNVEYLAVVDAEGLAPLERVAGPARVAAAVRLGRTRLIDNVAV
jgi:pantoate--beta-alanine ligase